MLLKVIVDDQVSAPVAEIIACCWLAVLTPHYRRIVLQAPVLDIGLHFVSFFCLVRLFLVTFVPRSNPIRAGADSIDCESLVHEDGVWSMLDRFEREGFTKVVSTKIAERRGDFT